jgi:two-component system, OmpR family, phosphate regulon response regulator PhoB
MSAINAVVIDDDRLNREIVARTLGAQGITTFQAGDAVKGFREIERNTPQLIVIDIVLPGELDGVGLCRLLRNTPGSKDSVIVIVTASDKRREAERAISAGADILIGKPFSPKQLWSQIDSLLKDRGITQ